MNYKDNLKKLREIEKVTQQDMANILNIARPVYTQYETQNKIIPIIHLNTIANYFNVSIDYILGLSTNKEYSINKLELNKKEVGARLKLWRKEQNLTQTKLANILNTTQSTIVEYEKGTTIIATSFLYTICKKYNISADYLLGRIDYPKYLK